MPLLLILLLCSCAAPGPSPYTMAEPVAQPISDADAHSPAWALFFLLVL